MEEIENAFDHIYKVCAACGQSRTLRNYRLNEKTKIAEGSDIRNIFSPICKCCEKHPEMQLKANRIEVLRAMRKKAEEKAAARQHEEQRIRFNHEKPMKVKKHKEWNKVNLC